MRILCACLLLSSILTSGYSWKLETTLSNVIPQLTDDVSLRCFYDGQLNGVEFFSSLSRIRLLKLVLGPKSRTWRTYAEIRSPNNSQPVLADRNQPGVSVSGYLGKHRNTYLSVKWAIASGDTVGSYICEIDGFTAIFGDNKLKYTEVVNITNDTPTISDIIDIIKQLKRRPEQKKNLQDAQIRMLKSTIMNEVDSAIKDNYYEVRYWPIGPYALLTDAHGCPNTPFNEFSAGQIYVQTESKDRLQHAFPPLFNYTQCTNCDGRNVLRLNFCTMTWGESWWHWPKGSYCVQRSNTYCVGQLRSGYSRFYLNSPVNVTVTPENIDSPMMVTHANKSIDFYFCCRNDGDVDTPILLPNAKPFYLFRFGGTCQTVYNMDVTNVNIQIDTDDNKENLFNNAYHADGTISNGRLELCYYTKKRTPT